MALPPVSYTHLAVKTMEAAAGGKVVSASMSEVTNGWVALVIKAADKKLVCVTPVSYTHLLMGDCQGQPGGRRG